MKKIILYIIAFLMVPAVYAASSTIEGTIKDADTGEELYGANVILIGTSLGASTDIEGKYVIRAVPAGTYTLRASYIGYTFKEIEVTVGEGAHVEQDLALTSVAVESEEVVITSQAEGQLQAINKQLSTDQIISAVSSARIQELPDVNAAESVSRLPGISLIRGGGEGEQVVVRGLAPKYNEVTVNGIKLSSSNADDRSTDLSMISSNMLAGIQVIKTITPDLDANILGGVVNFDLREALSTSTGAPQFSFLAQGSYNGLDNAYKKFNNYKFVATVENRLLDGTLGVFLQGSTEKRNLSANELAVTYGPLGQSEVDYLTRNITLDDITRERMRTNGVLALDYVIPAGKILLSNFFSTSETEAMGRRQFYDINTGTTRNISNFIAGYSKGTLNTISNLFRYEQDLSYLKITARLAHSYSETKAPKDWVVNFLNPNANLLDFANKENLDPRDIARAVVNDTSRITLNTITTNYRFTRERILSGAIDLELPVTFTDNVTSTFKFGGKYQYQKRSNDLNVINGEAFGLSSAQEIIKQLKNAFPWFKTASGDNTAYMTPFIDSGYDYGTFLDGDYQLVYPLNFSRLHDMVNYVYEHQIPDNITYNYNIGSSVTNDYWGQEDIGAVYAMATIKVGQFLTIIPGVRWQQLKTVYTAAQGIQGPNPASDYPYELVTVTEYHPYWFPALMIRYKPLDWFDVRLAYTNTVSYPDYASITPRINVALSAGTLAFNGFRLEPIRSANYDAYVSFYENTIGLFTVGAFLKQITDLSYAYEFSALTASQAAPFYPSWYTQPVTQGNVRVTRFLNNPYKINNYGMELDWQTHFWYLPGVLSGLVLNVNYTHIFSKAEYPFQDVNTRVRPARYTDSSYFAPLLYQPDDIVNVALGYDYKGFSIRISSIYTAKIFTGPTQWDQLLAYTDAYNRWDIAVKQELPLPGLKLYGNLNNINGANDKSVISASTGVPSREQSYGYNIEMGLSYEFR